MANPRGRRRAAEAEPAPPPPAPPPSGPVRSRIQSLQTVALDQIDGFKFGNPRSMKPGMREVLRNAFNELGFVDPVILRKKKDNRFEILDGHHRVATMHDMGGTNIDAVVVDVTDDRQARALALALNRIAADWEREKLANYFNDMLADGEEGDAEWLLQVTGFTGSEVEALGDVGGGFLDDIAGDGGEDGASGDASEGLGDTDGGSGFDPGPEHVNYSVSLSPEHNEVVHRAVRVAKKKAGLDNSGSALAHICAMYLDTEGK